MSNKTYYESMNGTMNMSSDFNKTSRRYGICQVCGWAPLLFKTVYDVIARILSLLKILTYIYVGQTVPMKWEFVSISLLIAEE